MTTSRGALHGQPRADVVRLWDFHNMGHELVRSDVAVGLGSHDLDVATHAAELFHAGYVERVVFTGANAPTTVERFPRGEAVHYREHALELGVPDFAILVEPQATNTAENNTFTQRLLDRQHVPVRSALDFQAVSAASCFRHVQEAVADCRRELLLT